MSATQTVHGRVGPVEPSYRDELLEVLRIIVVAGIPVGIVLCGFGSRLAMFVLRVTSPESVNGVESDDGFIIGQFTVGGTYNLVILGAATGVIGAAAYVAVAPWLMGPTWFRRATVGFTAGTLVGSLLLHSDGVDFNVLKPLWLAVALFIGLPVLVGVALTFAVDWAASPDSWAAQEPQRAWVPSVLVAVVLPSLIVLIPVALVVAVLLPLRRTLLRPIRDSTAATFAVRAVFITIPAASTFALTQDLSELF